jgi:5'-3' exonuclease
MVTFRSNNNNNNNNRRPPFRSNNNRRPPFRSNNEGSKFSNNDSFRRSVPGRNNHNAAKLIEKYNDLAREALANEDKILSENYFQHADHFTRVQNEQESIRMARVNSSTAAIVKPVEGSSAIDIIPTEVKEEKPSKIEVNTIKKPIIESAVRRNEKKIEKKTVEKKSAAS